LIYCFYKFHIIIRKENYSLFRFFQRDLDFSN
jgi:hypothetical protein